MKDIKFPIRLIFFFLSAWLYFQCRGYNTEELSEGAFLENAAIKTVLVKSMTSIQIIFSDNMNSAGLEEPANYLIVDENGVTLKIISLHIAENTGNRLIEIETDTQSPALKYILTVQNVMTMPGRPTLPGGARAEFFGATIAGLDRNPPDLLAPENDRLITGISSQPVTLVWAAKANAGYYKVEVVRDDNSVDVFLNPVNHIAGSPFTVMDFNNDGIPENTLQIILTDTDAYSYKWRVRADISSAGFYSSPFSFHAFEDTLYVFCPASGPCSDAGMTGNKSRPFQTIQQAILLATALNLKIQVANRDAVNTPYIESITFSEGTRLYGGYENINWTQTSTRTKIESNAAQVVFIANIKNNPAILDFFDLTSNSSLENNYVIYLQNNDNNLTVQNCRIQAGAGLYSYGVYNNNSSARIIANTINGGNADRSSGVADYSSSPYISDNDINGGNCISYCYGIRNESFSAPIIDSNNISGGSGTNSVGISNIKSSGKLISNRIIGGTGINSAHGIYNGESSPIIRFNSISGGSSLYSYGIYNSYSASPVISNNSISGGEQGRSYAILNDINASSVISSNFIDGGNGDRTYGFYYSGYSPLINNTIRSGTGITYAIDVVCGPISSLEFDNNIFFTAGSGVKFGIYETSGDPAKLRNNLIFDSGTGGSFSLYVNFIGGGTGNCEPGNNYNCLSDSIATTNAIDWSPTAPDAPTVFSGNLTLQNSESIASVFQYYPVDIIYTVDSADANTFYDGTSSLIEVKDNIGYCDKFLSGQYFEYFYNNTAYIIGTANCNTGGLNTISFSAALSYDFGAGVPVLIWNTMGSNYENKYSLQTTSPALNTGLACPAGYSAKTHSWGAGVDQAECDRNFPFANAIFNGGNCNSTYLSPAVEILEDSIGNDNGLCESGEACLQNDNIGRYAGHGNLIASSCDVSGIISGVILKKYDTNGY